MGFLSGLFRSKGPTRGELIGNLANRLAQADAKLPEFFGRLSLAEGQTPDGALAEWYALAVSATTYAIWASLGSKEKISPIVAAFQSAFVQRLGPGCRDAFLAIATVREQDYVRRISETLKSEDPKEAIRLSSSMAGRITGHYDEGHEKAGLPVSGSPDIITVTALWHLVVGHIVATKQMMDELQAEAPRLFSGPMV